MAFGYTTQQNDANGGHDVLPVGDYDATIIRSEDTISKGGGRDQIKLELDTGRGHLWYYLTDGDQYVGSKIASILASAGIFSPGLRVTSATFKGLQVRVRVKHEAYNGAMTAKIDRFLSRGGAAAPAPGAPATAAAATPDLDDGIPF